VSTVARGPSSVSTEQVGRASAASGLVRLSVMSSTRRVDLVLPWAVPVAELLPELARTVGLLDPGTAYAGYRLVTRDGRVLSTDSGLTTQGIEDGGVVTVAAGVEDEPPRVYDVVVEAVADAVRGDLAPWTETAGRSVALWGGVALLAPTAAALLLQHGSDIAAAAGVLVAVVSVLGAVVASRIRGDTRTAVALALVGSGYAATAGLMVAWRAPSVGSPLASGGAGALAAGSVAVLGVDRSRSLLLPPVVVGGVFLGTGLMVRLRSYDPAAALTTALALVVMAGSFFPWLALMATGGGIDRLLSTAVPVQDPDRIGVVGPGELDACVIDPQLIAADARVAHEILVGLSATVGVLLVLVAPLAVSLGPAGTLVAVLGCVVVMLRVRQYHTRAEVLVGLVSGVLGLMTTAVSVLWMHPSWCPGATAALAVTGAAFLARSLVPTRMLLRPGHVGGVAESLALLALPPALVTAIGALSSVRG
jgi:type VII secretion integral membrane protein EccD